MSPFHTPRPATWQVCIACGEEKLETDPSVRCACGGLLDVVHHAPEPADGLRESLRARLAGSGPHASGVWRYHELILPSVEVERIVTHPEGNTPLLSRPSVAEYAGCEGLLLKHEGHNPTGSFKDRGMTVGMTQAVRLGARAVACASTGNTAASLAAYAAQAGLRALVLVPAGRTAAGKLAQTLAYGARTLSVRGDFDACLKLLDSASAELGIYLLNSINPFRLEGQKTIVFELLQQLDWSPPDWIVLPAGNLGNTSAFGKALVEAKEWGLISGLPRIAAIQAAGAAPFAQGFAEQFRRRHAVQAETIATAIRIGDPASWDRAVRAIRATDGVVLSVSDPEILEAKRAIDRSGVGCEPASAASVAGVKRLVADGTIRKGERVVAVLTGHVLKDPEILLKGENQPVEVDGTVEALAAAVG